LQKVAELTAWAPARRFGLYTKGQIAEGYDADLALVDPSRSWTVEAAESESAQEYTPLQGLEIGASVESTFLRGKRIYADRKVTGDPEGRYLARPTSR
jgi:allantoinase